GAGTHVAYVYVGTPPQRVSVILDTGSSNTAFPCTGCQGCGQHEDPYWDRSASSTAQVSSCQQCVGDYTCTAAERCVFSQYYAEGSGWTAYQVEDTFYVGVPVQQGTAADKKHDDVSIDFSFGCVQSQTGLFVTQPEDGIMGMAMSDATLVPQLAKKGLIPHETFSLCFSYDGGYMVLGG
ncbi:aspartic peptidase domain-containing protein, partial [Tribonema minus]